MSFTQVISPMSGDVVDLLVEGVEYFAPGKGAYCARVGDANLFTSFSQVPGVPFGVVMYAGEDAGEVENMGNPTIQVENISWQVWLGTMSFSIEGRLESGQGVVGMDDLVDATYQALSGKSLIHAPHPTKLFHVSTTPPIIEDHRVISIQTWKGYHVRQGSL